MSAGPARLPNEPRPGYTYPFAEAPWGVAKR